MAVEQLQALGLNTYAARTFVALVGLGDGTAQEVSDVSDVPRTRVYDAVDELQDRALVDVQQSHPRRFWPVSTETAGRIFEREYAHHVESLREALDALGPAEHTEEQRGVWTVTGREAVADRVVEFVQEAEEEVAYMTAGALLTDEVLDELRAASERGVAIRLAGLEQDVEDDIQEVVPDADLFESLWVWSETPAGRILMVDGERTLVSVLVAGDGDYPPEPRDETALWGSGATNGLVVVLKAIFTWQLEDGRD